MCEQCLVRQDLPSLTSYRMKKPVQVRDLRTIAEELWKCLLEDDQLLVANLSGSGRMSARFGG